jgi:hypothetical protein
VETRAGVLPIETCVFLLVTLEPHRHIFPGVGDKQQSYSESPGLLWFCGHLTVCLAIVLRRSSCVMQAFIQACSINLSLQPNALDLIEREAFLGPIVKLGRSGAFVRSHRLGVLERPAILQIRRDAGCSKGMAADGRLDAGSVGSPADHAPGVGLRHRLLRQHRSLPALGGAEQPGLALLADAGGGE